jgi:hypothetical protein
MGWPWDESTKPFVTLVEGTRGRATVESQMVWDEKAKLFKILVEGYGVGVATGNIRKFKD